MSNSAEKKKELVEQYYRALMRGGKVRELLEQFYDAAYRAGIFDGESGDYQESK